MYIHMYKAKRSDRALQKSILIKDIILILINLRYLLSLVKIKKKEKKFKI